MPSQSQDYNLGLTFRSVFTKNDEYHPPRIELPPPATIELYELLDREFRSTTAQGIDAVEAVLTLSLEKIPPKLIDTIGRKITEGYDSAETKLKKDMRVDYSVPTSWLTGYINLPGSYSALVCVDDRGVVKVCGMNASIRVINANNVIDFSLVYAEPFGSSRP